MEQQTAVDSTCLKNLMLAVLASGLQNCLYRRSFVIIPIERKTIIVGNRRRVISVRWCLVQRWVRDRGDVRWLYSDSHGITTFVSLCEMFNFSPAAIRKKMEIKPPGWHATDRIITYSDDISDLRRIQKEREKYYRVRLLDHFY